MRNSSQQFVTFVKKEFAHVLRDRKTLLILFGLPIVQVIIFGFALTTEVKNARIMVIDHAKDDITREIVTKIAASRYFEVEAGSGEIEETFREGQTGRCVSFQLRK